MTRADENHDRGAAVLLPLDDPDVLGWSGWAPKVRGSFERPETGRTRSERSTRCSTYASSYLQFPITVFSVMLIFPFPPRGRQGSYTKRLFNDPALLRKKLLEEVTAVGV